MHTKPIDFTLFGATGFAGRQVVRHLSRACSDEIGTWALAGRSRDKLTLLAAELPPGVPAPAIVIADLSDPASIEAMLAQTRVVADLAGPYAEHGAAFVGACVRQGTDYVDLSGETFLSEQLIDAHHAAAQAAGVKIVPSCGYEALPFDLCALACAQQLRQAHQQACAAVTIVSSASGGQPHRIADMVSGGTVNTLKSALASDSGDARRLADPAALIEDPQAAAAVRARNPYHLEARYDDDVGAWTLPQLPVPFVNPPVVQRSAQLWAAAGEGYGDDFVYHEGMMLFEAAPTDRAKAAFARAMGKLLGGAVSLLGSRHRKLGRSLALRALEAFGPVTGEGPSDTALEEMNWRLVAHGRGEGGASVRVELRAEGHPGYRSTANLIAEATLALAHRRASLPDIAGVITPATAFGRGLDGVLGRAGIQLDVV